MRTVQKLQNRADYKICGQHRNRGIARKDMDGTETADFVRSFFLGGGACGVFANLHAGKSP